MGLLTASLHHAKRLHLRMWLLLRRRYRLQLRLRLHLLLRRMLHAPTVMLMVTHAVWRHGWSLRHCQPAWRRWTQLLLVMLLMVSTVLDLMVLRLMMSMLLLMGHKARLHMLLLLPMVASSNGVWRLLLLPTLTVTLRRARHVRGMLPDADPMLT
jgi:hypothetical protein